MKGAEERQRDSVESDASGLEIAIIGMAGRFPGASNIEEFWDNLKNGVESIGFFSEGELEEAGVEPGQLNDPAYVKVGSKMERADYFDASFFGYTPREAQVMPPQVRIFHRCVWEVLEDAGITPETYDGRIGLYAGASSSTYWEVLSYLEGAGAENDDFTRFIFTDKDSISTHIAFQLNLKGPAVVVQTACSTSLVAVHLAVQGLLNGESEVALAGGVTISPGGKGGYFYQEGMIMSKDGHVRTFDANASGMVGGNGAAVVVLKSLEDAVAQHDHIYAVIKGSAINNDGTRKVGYTAPSVEGQAAVIKAAQYLAGVVPETIGYIEAHGTATALGDPVEIEALTEAFKTSKRNFCAIGSVKTNVGHLDNAAGAVGLIKAALALYYKFLPPSLHFETPNPHIDFKNSPFYVVTTPGVWKPHDPRYPLRAGVSSFGIGGTNAHVILEEAPLAIRDTEGTGGLAPLSDEDGPGYDEDGPGYDEDGPGHDTEGTRGLAPLSNRQYRLILLSAKTETALEQMSRNLANHLQKYPGINLADVAYTLQKGRKTFPYKRMLACSPHGGVEAAAALLDPSASTVHTHIPSPGEENRDIRVVFMFPGLGSQHVDMGRDLYENEPLFRSEMDCCFEILKPLLDYNIREILYPSRESDRSNLSDRSDRSDLFDLNHTETAQLAVFIFEYALAKLLMQWGIQPDSMIGYSFGEYTAACISGVFSLEDALQLVVRRGQLLKKIPDGVMLSIPLRREELTPLLPSGMTLAIDNGPSCIAAGDPEAAAALEAEMKRQRYLTMRLPVEKAIHSHMMEPILKEFRQAITGVNRHKPRIPYISNVTGTRITEREACDPGYWVDHLRKTVRFSEGVEKLVKDPGAVLLEVGPGNELTALLARFLEKENRPAINLVKPRNKPVSDHYHLMNRLGRLWFMGVPIAWDKLYPDQRPYRVSLPTYPFEEHRYYLDPGLLNQGSAGWTKGFQQRGKNDIAHWFYVPSWKRLALSSEEIGNMPERACWLVFLDVCGLGDELVELLEKNGQQVFTARMGEEFKKEKNTQFTLDPDHAYENDYNELFAELCRMEAVPDRIVHLWSITGPDRPPAVLDPERLHQIKNRGYYSLEGIARAIGRRDITRDIRLLAISDNLHEVIGEDGLYPEKAMILGQIMVIPTEFANIKCRSIDIVMPSQHPAGTGSEPGKKPVRQLLDESISGVDEPMVAYRGGYRWVQCFEPRPLESPGEKSIRLKPGGVYLVTGGLGGVGLVMAEYLAKKLGAALILTGRTGLPPREQWEQAITNSLPHDSISLQIRKVKEIEELGTGLLVMGADVADPKQMQEVVARAEQQLGPISGIIHCAALTDGQMIQRRTRETSEGIFRSKITGTLVLDALFKDKELDFFVLCSSLSSILPAFGQAGYCAANAFLNAFALRRNAMGSTGATDRLTVSIAWDRWLGIGSSVIAEKRHSEMTGEKLTEGMSREQGMEAFNRILTNPFPQVLISISDLSASLKNAYQYQGSFLEAQWEKANTLKTTVPRPRLDIPYAPPQTPIEKAITEIFQKMFGYEQIGIHDDFFELGLDSIKAIQIRARMNKKGYGIQLEDFFKYTTAAALAPMVTILTENTTGVEKRDPGDPANQTPAALQIPAETMEILQTRYPVQIQDVYPLTPMQEGMLFYSLYETVNIQPYFEQVSYRLHGEMEVALIEKSANELIRRHDILRTAFVNEGLERPLQVVLKERNVEFTYRDLRAVYPGNREEKEAFIAGYKEKDKRRSFNLSSDVLIRLSVLQTEEAEYELIWSYHHALMDAWCMSILTTDYLAIYNSRREGKPHGLPPVPPFRAYIQWQAQQDKAKALRFWKAYLEGFEEMTTIPKKKNLADKALVLQEEFAGARLSAVLEIEQTRRLQEIAARARVTLSTIFHALWGILLGKYTGKQDVVFGSVVSGRPATLEGVENMVGCFINTIPVRVRFDGQILFQQLIRQLQEDILRTEPYHYFSLAEIQAQTPLKQNLLDHFIEFQNYPIAQQIEEVGDRWSSDNLPETQDLSHFQVFEQGNYDFIFDILPRERLRLSFSFNANVYDTELVTQLGKHTLNVLEQITRDWEIPIGKIRLLSETEERQILEEFNKKGDFSQEKTVNHLVEEHALHTPDRAAVVSLDTVLTYRGLHEQARVQSVTLKDHGIGPDRTVGILLQRTPLMMACILGVWQAGGAYIPLDSRDPAQRIGRVLTDSGTTAVITGEEYVKNRVPATYPGQVITAAPAGYVQTHALPAHEPKTQGLAMNRLAYVIYTSGSTGAPKGVMIEHSGMMNHIRVKIHDLGIKSTSIIAQNATHTFDISVWQFFTALTLGGRTVIYPDILILEPRRFISQLVNHGVTILEVVPSYLTMMLEVLAAGDIEIYKLQLQFLLVTGEEIKPNLVKNWFEKYPGIKMVNAYGPTEASDDITHYIMDRAPAGERIPIGRPVQNMDIYILDDSRQLSPIGVKGEICVTGAGVGRGYLNNPGLTDEKFLEVQEPFFKKVPGRRRLYLTGDVGRWLPGGVIEFFGRKDNQVKIRGFRVETGEIENCLNGYEPVRQAVVSEGKDKEGNKYLYAYLVMKNNTPLNNDELEKYLQENLPGYMIPSYFIQLEAVPLTANGKIDKARLPEPQMQAVKEYIPPRNEIEKILVNVWSEALNLDKESIGVEDNFFRLGGHSLTMIRVVSMLARDFDIRIDQVFRYPTIAGLAAQISYNKNRIKKHLQQLLAGMKTQTSPGVAEETPAAPDPQLEYEYRQYRQKVEAETDLDLSASRDYRHILLTGATGYLGAHVLYELLKREGTFIYLPVRASRQAGAAGAEKRLAGILSFYFGSDFYTRCRERLAVIPADLALPDLGLEKETYRRLAAKLEVIVHSAGNVSHYGLYRDHYRDNVKAAENLLEFALAAKRKDFHHISTMGVCGGRVEGKDSQLFSEYRQDCGQEVRGNYLQTKLEAEKRVVSYREKGLKTSIYRPGNVVFHSETGKFQVNIAANAFYSMLGVIIKFGIIPREFMGNYDFTFVDCLAQAIVLLFDREALSDELYHLYNHQRISVHDLIKYLNANGEKVRQVSLEEFVRFVYDNLENPAVCEQMDRFLFLFGVPSTQGEGVETGSQSTRSMAVNDRTRRLLAKRGFYWPEVTGEHIKKMVKHCHEVGFF